LEIRPTHPFAPGRPGAIGRGRSAELDNRLHSDRNVQFAPRLTDCLLRSDRPRGVGPLWLPSPTEWDPPSVGTPRSPWRSHRGRSRQRYAPVALVPPLNDRHGGDPAAPCHRRDGM